MRRRRSRRVSGAPLRLDTRHCKWCTAGLSRTTASVAASFDGLCGLNASLYALANAGCADCGGVGVTYGAVVGTAAEVNEVLYLK